MRRRYKNIFPKAGQTGHTPSNAILPGCFILCLFASSFYGCDIGVDTSDFGRNYNLEESGGPDCITESDCDSGICLATGKCAVQAYEGDSCDLYHVCATDLECTEGFCQRRPEIECIHDSQCESNRCLPDGRCAVYVGMGDDCDLIHLCTEGLLCLEGICHEP